MKLRMVSKLRILNRLVFHTLHCPIKHLAIITRETTKKIEILKRGGKLKSKS